MQAARIDPTFLAIEGVIGVGKSTLARKIAERLDARLVLEEVEENPFLASFYKDRRRYAFSCQLFFLLSRYRQQRTLGQRDLFSTRIVCDYLFQKDRIFAALNLDEAEMGLYEQILPLLERDLPTPDRVVYLQASVPTLLRRIERRGRSYEQGLDRAYLQELCEGYNRFFFHYDAAPLLVVNTDSIDFVESPEDLEDLWMRIREHASGTLYYNPQGPAR
ncbi:MAG: deoxynucleoside kinase [Candidatus Eisenbacteria bacterium]|nr:deoxynucleoside kinase [Candidatus Eisenbacteria bacterium]